LDGKEESAGKVDVNVSASVAKEELDALMVFGDKTEKIFARPSDGIIFISSLSISTLDKEKNFFTFFSHDIKRHCLGRIHS